MSEKRKSTDGSSGSKKKTRQYLQSYLDFGFMEGQAGYRPECVICGEKLANDSMKPNKLSGHQETNHHQTIGESRKYFERKKQLALADPRTLDQLLKEQVVIYKEQRRCHLTLRC